MTDHNTNVRRSHAPARGRKPADRPVARPASPVAARRTPPSRRRGWFASLDHRCSAAKWVLLAALIAYTALVIGANSARDVDFGVIATRMAAAPGVTALDAMDENAFQERLGTPPEGCEGWLYYGSEEIMNVSEVMAVKAGDAALDRLEAAVRNRIEAQLAVFRDYGTDQKQLLESARVIRRGTYLFYAVGADADIWEDAFLSAIR